MAKKDAFKEFKPGKTIRKYNAKKVLRIPMQKVEEEKNSRLEESSINIYVPGDDNFGSIA